MPLTEWGLHQEVNLESDQACARVLEESKNSFLLGLGSENQTGAVAGKLRNLPRLERPVVGDWVVVRRLENERKLQILNVLNRTSLLVRKAAGETEAVQPLAANADFTAILTSVNRDFNERRIERYLSLVRECRSQPVLLLTKSDLADESAKLARHLSQTYHCPCLALSPLTGMGVDQLVGQITRHSTLALLGSSGVGKSTLVNRLLEKPTQSTAEIRESDDRGRHTTTRRSLFRTKYNFFVIDTPGLREIQLTTGEGIDRSFVAIEALSPGCKFSNCGHDTEPGCAVKNAVKEGSLDAHLLESYLKLKKETKRSKPPRY